MCFTNPVFENIPLLAKPILHYTIFGVAPREIMGEAAFKKVKAEVQARADHHCEICLWSLCSSHYEDTRLDSHP